MMSQQLLLLLALATVSWINAVERCVDCNLLTTNEALDIPRPVGCTTDCFLQDHTKPDVFTPWSKLGPVLQFGDAGIYYEPSEMLPFDQVAFIPQPFYILNPTYQDRRVSRSATKLDEDTESTPTLKKHFPKSRYNKLDKHRRKEDTGHKKSERQFKKLPFYLDVDVQEPRTETRGTPAVETHFINLKLAEHYLSVCLDLHVLEFYRKNDSAFKNLRDVWDYPKFHYYESLSDLDLEKEIIVKCNHSMDIVKKSLDEIKDTWPKTKNLSFSASRDFPINAITDDVSNNNFHINSEGMISNVSPVKTIFNPINLPFTEKSTSVINNVNLPAKINRFVTQNIVKDSVFRTINPYNNVRNQFQLTLIPPVDQMHFEVTTASIAGSGTLAKNNNVPRVTQHPTMRETSHLPNFYVEDNLYLNSSAEQGHKHIEGNSKLSGYTNTSNKNTSYINSKIYFIPMMQRTLNIVPKEVQAVYDTTTPDMTEHIITESETFTGNKNNEGSSTTSYAENDNTYSEVNNQVPEVVTKEYPNDTATSVVEGFKDSLFNNNSTFIETDSSALSVTSNTTPIMTTITVHTTEKNEQKNMNYENFLSGEHLTGNLYFLYRNHSVPARFIQHEDGKINVGLDGYTLCDSVNDSTVKFILFDVLCNCIKFSNCTNRYTR